MSRAFLIGAGATRAQYKETPLSDDFFKILKKYHTELFADIETTIQPHINTPLENLNVEDAIMMSYDPDFPQSNKISFHGALYSAIYKLLAEPTESDSRNMNTYINDVMRSPSTLFKKLLDNLHSENPEKDDFFMTLNYDLYLDREVLSTQRKIDYGIEEETINTNKGLPLSKEPNFSVYHLHGSLNWEDVRVNKINLQLGAISPRYIGSESNLCLIPPGKKEFPPIIESIWATAEERLLKADELIIIGCSLNPKDTELIELIKKFIDKKGANNVKIISLCTDKSCDCDNYREIIGNKWNERDKHYRCGFNISPPPIESIGSVNPRRVRDEPPQHKLGAIEFIFNNPTN